MLRNLVPLERSIYAYKSKNKIMKSAAFMCDFLYIYTERIFLLQIMVSDVNGLVGNRNIPMLLTDFLFCCP